MKKYFRKLVNLSISFLAPAREILALATLYASAVILAYTIPAPSFIKRIKSVLTVPVPAYSGYQAGAGMTMVNVVIGVIVVLVGLIVIFTKVLPQVYTNSSGMSSNMTAAGASTDAVQYWTWIMWGLIVLVVIGAGFKLIKHFT